QRPARGRVGAWPGWRPRDPRRGPGAGAAGGGGGCGGGGGAGSGGRAGPGGPSSANVPSTVPTFTVWPGDTWIFSTRPPIGDGISTWALSVSTSSSGASSAMTSPSRTRTATISASVKPSPRSGSANGLDIRKLELQGLAAGGQQPGNVGQVGALAGKAHEWHVVGGDPEDRRLERQERALHDRRGH